MRAVRFGSYSIVATLAGIPSLSRRKSMIRYCCLWPPPWCRVVIRPWALRPARFGFGTVSDRSGLVEVISEKSANDAARRPGVVGLALRTVMASSCSLAGLEELDLVAGRQLDDRSFGARPGADDVAGPLGLALAVVGVDGDDLDPPDLLDRVTDVGLGGRAGDEEGVGVVVDQAVGLLGHDRPQDDVTGRDAHSAPPASGSAPASPASLDSPASPASAA